jgi:ABC-type transport system involved in multi-copper enzyme maturation permease subunit
MHQLLTIAHYTVLEARRTRLLLLFAVALGLVFALAFFVSALAVTESLRMQTTFYAAGARLAAVFFAAVHVIGSVTREFNDKGLDTLLALDVPRPHYILGKLAGFLAIGAIIGILASIPVFWMAPAVAAVQWSGALVLELGVVIAFSLFCVTAFGQFMPSAVVVLAFYVLARSLTAIRLMSAHPISGADTLSHDIGRWMIEGLALIAPALDRWSQTTWLIDTPARWADLSVLLAEAMLYITLLAGAAMVDFNRRNF